MTINVDDNNRVIWYNKTLTEQQSQRYLNDNTYYVEDLEVPNSEEIEGKETILCFSNESGFYYQYIQKNDDETVISSENSIQENMNGLKLKSIQHGTVEDESTSWLTTAATYRDRYITISPVDVNKTILLVSPHCNAVSSSGFGMVKLYNSNMLAQRNYTGSATSDGRKLYRYNAFSYSVLEFE